MSHCAVDAIRWKNRRAYRLSNGKIEITVLPGGGHIADPASLILRSMLSGNRPGPRLSLRHFLPREHAALYGDGPVGRFLCGYTGHALALAYFGMPSRRKRLSKVCPCMVK